MANERRDKRASELESFVKKGEIVKSFESTEIYRLLMLWLDKKIDMKQILESSGDKRTELCGYLRLATELKEYLSTVKRFGEKKKLELNDLIK